MHWRQIILQDFSSIWHTEMVTTCPTFIVIACGSNRTKKWYKCCIQSKVEILLLLEPI